MTARKRKARRHAAPAGVDAALCACGVRVDAEERLHLVNACAFFRADRHRPAEPGKIRKRDLLDAARDVDAAIGHRHDPDRQ